MALDLSQYLKNYGEENSLIAPKFMGNNLQVVVKNRPL